jgi:crossover junction endodeoxyribonuclease RuvC
MQAEKIIMGIDPGTSLMGFAIISIKANKIKLLALDVLMLSKYTNHAIKLKKIFERSLMLIDTYLPDEVALEAPFFGVNVQSMLKLGRAQGVAMAASLYRDIPITEYAPKKVKMSVTGNGNASKEQVAKMLHGLVDLKDFEIKHLDATDALAVAVCHHYNAQSLSEKTGYNGWESFVNKNPDRIK